MIEKDNRFSFLIKWAIVLSAISSVSVLFALISLSNDKAELIIKIIASIVFWFGLFVEQAFIWRANSLRKESEGYADKKLNLLKLGIFSVCKNRYGLVADAALLLSIIAYIICAVGDFGSNKFQIVLIFVVLLSFRMHCILNGKNFCKWILE